MKIAKEIKTKYKFTFDCTIECRWMDEWWMEYRDSIYLSKELGKIGVNVFMFQVVEIQIKPKNKNRAFISKNFCKNNSSCKYSCNCSWINYNRNWRWKLLEEVSIVIM